MTVICIRRTLGVLDSTTGGDQALTGITKVNGSIAPNRKVFLMLRDTLKLRRETISDSFGNYTFNNLNLNFDWLILSVDSNKVYRTELIDRLAT